MPCLHAANHAPIPSPLSSQQHASEADVSEILLTGLGPGQSCPHLIALVDKDLVIYAAFPYRQDSSSSVAQQACSTPQPSSTPLPTTPSLATQLSFTPSQIAGHLRLRFSKVSTRLITFPSLTPSPLIPSPHNSALSSGDGMQVHHKVILCDRKRAKTVKQLSQQEIKTEQAEEKSAKFVAQLRTFQNIGGYSGVSLPLHSLSYLHLLPPSFPLPPPSLLPPSFLPPSSLPPPSLLPPSFLLQVFVCGAYPHWLMLTQHQSLHLHPMFIDGPITSFTAFHNVNCPHGFLYFSAEASQPPVT